METKVYFTNTAPLAEDGLYRAALEAVDPQRREKTLRLRPAADRRLSLGAGLLVQKALRDCGMEARDLRFCCGENGKPRLLGAENFHFNLSHAGDYAMAAVSGAELGCDIEKIGPVDLKVARRFFCPEEYLSIAALPQAAQADLFFRYWTLKESFVKAIGRGLSLPLNAFRIVLGADGRVRAEQAADGREMYFTEPAPPPGYRCAVCETAASSGIRCETGDVRRLLGQTADSQQSTVDR